MSSYVDSERRRPRLTRFIAQNVFLVGANIVVSLGIASLIVVLGGLTPKERRHRHDLTRDGRIAYTNDVQAGSIRQATVFYTFAYNGVSYKGNTFLPREYSDKVSTYTKNGSFPILFLPRDPSINHPADWTGDGPTPIILPILIMILIAQWDRLIWFSSYRV